ncbi:MAG TPA: hypothetical protein VIO11_05135 [Candidatus Methanoperedens sp.]
MPINPRIPTRQDLFDKDDFIRDQVDIAERWLTRGNKIDGDIYAKFFFYFAGFNALYFLWGIVNEISGSRPRQQDLIENLLCQFGDTKAKEILDKVKNDVDYFRNRNPIQAMIKRKSDKKFLEGDQKEGKDYQDTLNNESKTASQRLVAFAKILYLVRSNLVHGSKRAEVSGDDETIIAKSIKPMEIFLTEAIEWTKGQCPFY